MGLPEAIKNGFLKFDFIIFILFAVNMAFFIMYIISAKRLNNYFIIKGSKANKRRKKYDTLQNGVLDEDEIRNLRNAAVTWNNIFVNVTSLFPLLGILGTVWSLLNMINDGANFDSGFYAALTSTLWGLVFAIIFKAVEFIPASKLEAGEREADHAFERIEFEEKSMLTGDTTDET